MNFFRIFCWRWYWLLGVYVLCWGKSVAALRYIPFMTPLGIMFLCIADYRKIKAATTLIFGCCTKFCREKRRLCGLAESDEQVRISLYKCLVSKNMCKSYTFKFSLSNRNCRVHSMAEHIPSAAEGSWRSRHGRLFKFDCLVRASGAGQSAAHCRIPGGAAAAAAPSTPHQQPKSASATGRQEFLWTQILFGWVIYKCCDIDFAQKCLVSAYVQWKTISTTKANLNIFV